LRILIVTEHYWPETFRINDLAAGLRERGHELSVVAALPNYPVGRFFDGYGLGGPWRETVDGSVVQRVPVWPRGRGKAWSLALNYSSYVLTATTWLAAQRPSCDAILVFQPSPVTTIIPALVGRNAGTPIVAWVLDLWPDTLESTGMLPSKTALRFAGALSGWLYRRCDAVLGQSRAYRARFEAMGVTPDRIGYLPSWAEEVYGTQAPAVPDQAVPWGGEFSVMFAGNLGKVQALDTVLDAAEEVRRSGRSCHWVFVGDGSARDWLEAEIRRRELGASVHLVGRRPLAEMPSWYARASAMLVSLKPDPVLAMTIPAKIQSYLAASMPILTSMDGEGARVVAESGAGLVSPAGDARGLAENTLKMMDLSVLERAHLGAAGRAYYERNFSRSVALDRIEEVFRRLVVRKRPP
jgi:glycosyltransferase involved in cell wall biosynthesis